MPPVKLSPMTPDEKKELSEIIQQLFSGPRFSNGITTYVNRNALNGAPHRTARKPAKQPKGTPSMSPTMQQSLNRQFARIDAEAARRKASNTSGLMALELGHYGEPIKIHPSKYGLSLEEVEAMREPKAMLALEEYAREFKYLSDSGMTLRSYVASGWSDYVNEPLPPRLGSACDKLQAHFGRPVSIASQFGASG